MTTTVQKSLRLPERVVREINDLAKVMKKDFTAVANDLLEEAIRSHRCPGIVFSDGASGRRARIAGTGIEVWEVVAAYKSVGKSMKRLQQTYPWMTEQQIKAAIGYYASYGAEIDKLIDENENWTAERILQQHPFLSAGR